MRERGAIKILLICELEMHTGETVDGQGATLYSARFGTVQTRDARHLAGHLPGGGEWLSFLFARLHDETNERSNEFPRALRCFSRLRPCDNILHATLEAQLGPKRHFPIAVGAVCENDFIAEFQPEAEWTQECLDSAARV